MRKSLLLLLVSVLVSLIGYGQIVITEIMYNPPESGTDSLEFVEFYNAGDASVDLAGYTMEGVEFTFPSFNLDADAYVLVSVDSLAFYNFYGVESFQCLSGGLSNGGENIVLYDAGGNVVDSVNYDDAGDWPSADDGTDGAGGSIVLCDYESDNTLGTNWTVSTAASVGQIDGTDVYASPGAVNCGGVVPGPSLTITSPTEDEVVYQEDVLISFNVNFFTIGEVGTGADGHVHYSLDDGAMQMHYSTDDISLTGLTAGTHSVVLVLVDDSHNQIDPLVADTVNFEIDLSGPAEVSIYDIQFTEDTSGESPLLGTPVKTRGVVTSLHYSYEGGTYKGFFIQAGEGAWNGIYVFHDADEPQIGDSVVIEGMVDEFYDATQIKDLTSYTVLNSGNTLPAVTAIETGEMEESLEGVLISVSQAVCTEEADNYGVWKVNSNNTGDLAVDDDIYSIEPTLTWQYNLVGIGYYSYGAYKILPRSADDVTDIDIAVRQGNFYVYPNPASEMLYLNDFTGSLSIYNTLGELVKVEQLVNQNSIEIQDLNTGIYIFIFTSNTGDVNVIRIMKK